MSLTKVFYSMINGAYVNILDYGADSTGTNDSTTAIQNAIDDAPVGGTVFFPAGTYLSSAISITKNIQLLGSGSATIIKTTAGATDNFITIDMLQDQENNVVITDFDFTIQNPAVGIGAYIYIKECVAPYIQNCIFHGFGATYAIDHLRGYGLTVTDCVFTDILSNGIHLANEVSPGKYSYVTRITNCDFGPVSGSAVIADGGQDYLFESCVFEIIGSDEAIKFGDIGSNYAMTFVNCWWEGNQTYEIYLPDGITGSVTIIEPVFNAPLSGGYSKIRIGTETRVTLIGMNGGGGSNPTTIYGDGNSSVTIIGSALNYIQSGTYSWNVLADNGLTLSTGPANYFINVSGTSLVANSSGNGDFIVKAPTGGTETAAVSLVCTGTGQGQMIYRPSTSVLQVWNNNNATGVQLASNGTSWSSYSDERIKENLVPIEDALNKVSTLRSVTGHLKGDEDQISRSFLIAQDVQKVLPEAVDESDPEALGLRYTDVIPLLVAAIKELKTEIDTLKGAA